MPEVLEPSESEFAREDLDLFHDWVERSWDPCLRVREWWARLAAARYSSTILPYTAGGRGWSRSASQEVNVILAKRGVPGPPLGVGITLVAPTLAYHANGEQVDEFVPSILDGTQSWCQLFSEPAAGSDLASLETYATCDGTGWLVTGTKTWTSGADMADMGFLLARTDRTASKHAGITAFAIDMHQPGVSVRPLRLMNGRGGFSTVALQEARVPSQHRLGASGGGWALALAMLSEERASYRAAGSGGLVTGRPGTIAGDLEVLAGQLMQRTTGGPRILVGDSEVGRLVGLATELGCSANPVVRQRLVKLAILTRLSNMIEKRGPFPGSGNIAKLIISETFRVAQAAGSCIAGPAATVSGQDAATDGWLQELIVYSPGPAIYGGTDEIQKNILAERVLGLPRI